ncbi:hypothetical protein [Streptomyces sp. 4F14]|uniref:hypothetical protein n=1 Tax=Streptomyces sp. 4F14 TaxID=3394380 RepID=UPI003A885491
MTRENRTTGAWLVLGGIHLLNQTALRRQDEPIVLIRVIPQAIYSPSTTVVIRWDTLGACPATAHRTGCDQPAKAMVEGCDLFPDAIAGTALRALVGTSAALSLVPLCYLEEHPNGGYHAYAQIRFHPEDACFLRTTREPVGHGPVDTLNWLDPVLSAHAESSRALNNHLRYFRTYFAGTELEYKYTLAPAPDIWAASVELLKTLRDGQLEGCRPEYRGEFEIHYTENHLFEVTGPEEEAGYASFIPTVSAGYVLKRKWFTRDAFARREALRSGIDVSPDGFEEYLSTQLGLRVHPLPPFQRVRYDVQCESMRTGHVFGVFFDRSSLVSAPEVTLSQCELEYRRSRGVLGHDENEIIHEMDRINAWLRTYLAEHGWATHHTYYSKLSFLRDTVAARPELAAR